MNNTNNASLIATEANNSWVDDAALAVRNPCLIPLGESVATVSPDNCLTKSQVQNIIGPIMFIIVLFGLCGNMTSIAVMSTKQFRSMAISRPIRCLAVSDSLYLIFIINNQIWFHDLIGVDIRTLSDAACKIVNWMTRSTAIVSAWMVILLAAERFCAIWFFQMSKQMFSVLKMTISIVIIILITSIFNAVWTNYSDGIVNGMCLPNVYGGQVTKNFLAACVFLYVGIPAPILFILNLMIIIKLYMHKKKSGSCGSVKIPHMRITGMLLSVTTVFILFVPPIALCHMVAQMLGENLFASNQLPLYIVGQAAQLLFVGNCAINFYLYVVMGSTFRNKLISMLCFRCRGAAHVEGVPSAITRKTSLRSQEKQSSDIRMTPQQEKD